jgi:hypothetical protein
MEHYNKKLNPLTTDTLDWKKKIFRKETWLTASPNATNANSPPGARRRPILIADIIEIPKNLPTKATNTVLPPIKSPNDPIMAGKFETRSFGSMDIPT